MKNLLFMLLLGLFSLVGLKPAFAARPGPTIHPRHPRHQHDSVAVAPDPVQAVAVAPVPLQLERPAVLPAEQATEASDACRFYPRWHYVPIDSIRVRRWRSQLRLPDQVRTSTAPFQIDYRNGRGPICSDTLHVDPGRRAG